MADQATHGLLCADDPAPVSVERAGAPSPILLVCDHAGRATPRLLGALGLPEAAFEQHIAWDIGALALARRLSETLDATLVHQTYSRLVIDCNRAPDHPGSIVTESDGWAVPANRELSSAAITARRRAVFDPYHARLAAVIDRGQAEGRPTLLVSVHSFTPAMGGVARPWHFGVLHMGGSPASAAMLAMLGAIPGLVVGDNEPYAMDGTDFTVPVQAHARGIDAIEVEVRQDLLANTAGVAHVAGILTQCLAQIGCRPVA